MKVYPHPKIHSRNLMAGAKLAWRHVQKPEPHMQELWIDEWFHVTEAAVFHAVEEGKVKEWTP